MTLPELLEIGDEVVFHVDPQTRNWTTTFRDIPDGTKGTVCGFEDAIIFAPRVPAFEHTPGVYHQRGAVSVYLPNGRIVPGSGAVQLVDQAEEKRRDSALRDERNILRTPKVRIGDLPPTLFWEQDTVRVRFPNNPDACEMVIVGIDYSFMHKIRDDGSPYPFYRVMFPKNNSIMSAAESWIELVEQGNVRKHYHGQRLSFSDVQEEADFARLVGKTEEVRNPKSGLFRWTKEEVLDAIRAGHVDGFVSSNGFFRSGVNISARRFHDAELGARVAQTTLEGFTAAV